MKKLTIMVDNLINHKKTTINVLKENPQRNDKYGRWWAFRP
jgi:hypothetical protein